jgi:flagellar operon protein
MQMSLVDIENRILNATAPIKPAGSPNGTPAAGAAKPDGPSFSQVLADQLTAGAAQARLKFSGHAQQRLASRQINLTADDLQKIGDAVTRAAAKGARESLVLTDKAALVVSVPNRTVITAVDKSQLKENIFTNIDSAVIV